MALASVSGQNEFKEMNFLPNSEKRHMTDRSRQGYSSIRFQFGCIIVFHVFRITKLKHSSEAFTGQGAKDYPGRWNLLGYPVVYTSENTSLACLESVSHLLDDFDQDSYLIFEGAIPLKLVKSVENTDLPSGWDDDNPGKASQEFGTEWLKSGRSAVLKVPSILVPNDSNFLINPSHPDFRLIRVGKPKPFRFHPYLTYKHRVPVGR